MTYELTLTDRDVLSDYGTLPKLIGGFAKQELVEELVKREGVTSYICPKQNEYEVKIFEADGDGEAGYGNATILVVK
ncbi:MAG: hypothetical protein WC998_06635 [Candidatus Paceibacterota bacterium]|jgi:hypothetical protein